MSESKLEQQLKSKIKPNRQVTTSSTIKALMNMNQATPAETEENVRQVDVNITSSVRQDDVHTPKKKVNLRKKRKTLYFSKEAFQMLEDIAPEREQSLYVQNLIIQDYNRIKEEANKPKEIVEPKEETKPNEIIDPTE